MNKYDIREKDPLSDQQYMRLLSIANNKGGEHLKTILFLRWTGCHVSILSQPILYDLHTEKEEDGLYIVWRRTKKRGKDAYTSIKAHPMHKGVYDIEEWINELRTRREARNARRISRQYFYHLVKDVGRSAGLPELSPMSFRHTFGVWLLNQGAPEEFVRQKLNCSPRVLRTYAKYTRQTEKPMYDRLGW